MVFRFGRSINFFSSYRTDKCVYALGQCQNMFLELGSQGPSIGKEKLEGADFTLP